MNESIAGRVLRLHRYPLKSADGEELAAVDVTASGLVDDRRWTLARADGAVVTAKEAPGLRNVRASVEDDRLRLDPPLETVVRTVLDGVVDGPVDVRDAPGTNQQVAAVHLVSAGAATAWDAPSGCDPEPRANIVVELAQPGLERSWIGRVVRLGDVQLKVTRTPSSCLGVYAEVLAAGTLHVGDDVEVLEQD